MILNTAAPLLVFLFYYISFVPVSNNLGENLDPDGCSNGFETSAYDAVKRRGVWMPSHA